MEKELIVLNEARRVTLTAYVQEADGEFQFAKRPAILIMPGGGYAMCSDREADPVAMAYLKAGYQAFVLRYSTGAHKAWPNPLDDYEQAMTLIEENADKWHLDKTRIAAVGFSAGGHLCACAATIAQRKPAAAILVYPAILKDICDLCQPGMPQPNEYVAADTCPCFLVAARDDRTVDIKNSLMMQLALAEHGVAFESHTYSYGGHGFSTAEEWINTNRVSHRVSNWVPDSIGWLEEIFGTLTSKGFVEPDIKISMNANNAPVLSVECTLGHIRKQSEAVQEILHPLFEGIKAVSVARGYTEDGLMAAVSGNTVRELMEMVQVPDEVISKIDKVLHEMVNQL